MPADNPMPLVVLTTVRCGGYKTNFLRPVIFLFFFFSITKIHISYWIYWISRSYMIGVATAQLCRHLSNMNLLQRMNRYFWRIKYFACREINERSFSNLHPWSRRCTGLAVWNYEWAWPVCVLWMVNVENISTPRNSVVTGNNSTQYHRVPIHV